MPLSEDRIFYYQRIASSFEVNDLDVLKLEVIDRFGPLVRPAENVFLLAKLRVLYARSMVSKIDINERSVVFSFHKKDTPTFDSYLDSVFLKLSTLFGIHHPQEFFSSPDHGASWLTMAGHSCDNASATTIPKFSE